MIRNLNLVKKLRNSWKYYHLRQILDLFFAVCMRISESGTGARDPEGPAGSSHSHKQTREGYLPLSTIRLELVSAAIRKQDSSTLPQIQFRSGDL